jgi:hypothetical protein
VGERRLYTQIRPKSRSDSSWGCGLGYWGFPMQSRFVTLKIRAHNDELIILCFCLPPTTIVLRLLQRHEVVYPLGVVPGDPLPSSWCWKWPCSLPLPTQHIPQPLINSLYRAYVLSVIRCALVNDYVTYYLPFGCRRHDLVRSFTTLMKLLGLLVVVMMMMMITVYLVSLFFLHYILLLLRWIFQVNTTL